MGKVTMINIKRALRSDRIMKALTGLSKQEFNELVDKFVKVLNRHRMNSKKGRKRAIGAGRKHTLRTPEEKLFYILFYMKCYPTFDLASFFFNVDRAQTCRWMHELLLILEQALQKELVLPKRQIRSIEEFEILFPEIMDIFIDAVERPTQRPKDSKKQREHYSGKKKRHTKKNIIISDENKEVLILTETEPGKDHDYKAFKRSQIPDNTPEDVTCWVDLGFMGIQKDYQSLDVVIPHKKPKNKELTRTQRDENRTIRGIRVVVEHTISGVKRLRCVSDIYRNRKPNTDDKFMLLASGVWNYHLKAA